MHRMSSRKVLQYQGLIGDRRLLTWPLFFRGRFDMQTLPSRVHVPQDRRHWHFRMLCRTICTLRIDQVLQLPTRLFLSVQKPSSSGKMPTRDLLSRKSYNLLRVSRALSVPAQRLPGLPHRWLLQPARHLAPLQMSRRLGVSA